MLLHVLRLRVVALLYVDGPPSPSKSRTSHKSRGLVQLRLLSIHQMDAHNPSDDKTCTSNQNLIVASHRIQASQVPELQREQPLQVNKSTSPSTSTSSLDPPLNVFNLSYVSIFSVAKKYSYFRLLDSFSW
jgi:hypothetical protein